MTLAENRETLANMYVGGFNLFKALLVHQKLFKVFVNVNSKLAKTIYSNTAHEATDDPSIVFKSRCVTSYEPYIKLRCFRKTY